MLRTVETRSVHTGEEPFLYQVYASTRQDEVGAWGWDPAQQEGFMRMQFQAQSRSYAWQFPGADHLIIGAGAERIGRLLVDRTEQEIRLVDIALLPEYRGRGIGTHLIQVLQQEAEETGRPLRLSVQPANPARLLYAKLGFITTADDGLYRSMEWSPTSQR